MRVAQIRPDEFVRLDHTEYGLRVLRYRGVVELAWVGCNDEELAAKGGNASKSMIRKMPLSRVTLCGLDKLGKSGNKARGLEQVQNR